MLVTKDIYNTVFNYIDPWGKTIEYIAQGIRASYHLTIMAIPGQAFFCREMLLNLTSVLEQRVVTAAKQQQVDIDHLRENSRQVMHDYAIGNRVYAEMTGIYRKLDYSKKLPYIITELFTNGTV